MRNFFYSINNIFLNRVDEGNFVLYKKGQFLMIMNLIFILLMIMLTLTSFSFPPDRARSVLVLTFTGTLVTLAILMVLRTGRVQGALNSFAIFTAILSIAGFLAKPPHLAGVSLAYFMLMGLAYTSLFCSVRLTTVLLLSFIASHLGYYFLIGLPSADGVVIETVKTALLDGLATLLGTFAIGVAASRILNRALEITVAESEKNSEQYDRISSLNEVMNRTFEKLNDSINVTSEVVENFSGTFQNQAATFEELAASMEEISANTTNVAFASKSQNDSVGNLFERFEVLASSVDTLEENGKDRTYAPYKYEIEMIKNREFDENMLNNIRSENS